MRAAVFYGEGDIRVEDQPDPIIEVPTDAIVRVVRSCVCGSDLWSYRGANKRKGPLGIGHEFVGVVEDTGSEVTDIKRGDLVIAPFTWSCGTCPECRYGFQSVCRNGGFWGSPGSNGGQGEQVRVPLADGTLYRVDGITEQDTDLLPGLLTLSDVMCTGHHAAVSAGVTAGSTVAVVGDGAVGLSAVIAAKRLGAARVIALSRNPARQELARAAGADDVIAERGDDAVAALLETTDSVGVDFALECVGTEQSMSTALGGVRAGGHVGFVGVPHGSAAPMGTLFSRNITVSGGVAPARAYIAELLPDVLSGAIHPEIVFDGTFALEETPAAYAAMHERRVTKALLIP